MLASPLPCHVVLPASVPMTTSRRTPTPSAACAFAPHIPTMWRSQRCTHYNACPHTVRCLRLLRIRIFLLGRAPHGLQPPRSTGQPQPQSSSTRRTAPGTLAGDRRSCHTWQAVGNRVELVVCMCVFSAPHGSDRQLLVHLGQLCCCLSVLLAVVGYFGCTASLVWLLVAWWLVVRTWPGCVAPACDCTPVVPVHCSF